MRGAATGGDFYRHSIGSYRGRATLVFVDIEPDTATVSWEAVEAAVTDRTTALIAAHYRRVGSRPGYAHYLPSSNYRLSDFQAALLLSHLSWLPQWMPG